MKSVSLGKYSIGETDRCFVIAEAGVNHNGQLDLAVKLIDAAVAAGVDAIKFQTFRAEEVVSPSAPKAAYQKESTGTAESQLEMVKKLELSASDFAYLSQYCATRNIMFLSTPFDFGSVDLLLSLNVEAFKIPSGEITNFPFLRYVARTGKPIILSTGMSTLDEVAQAVETLREAGCSELVLLHCTSNYPAAAENVNLRAMKTLRDCFDVPTGFSDHTEGSEIPLAAAALGACVVEKHFTLDRSLPGPDHRASLEPPELATMVRGIRKVEVALGTGDKTPFSSELDTAAAARRSLVAADHISAGTVLSETMIAIRRPGTGLAPRMLVSVVGKKAVHDIEAGALLTLEMLK
jgi:N,N'-diacetyllegionaminate synthase